MTSPDEQVQQRESYPWTPMWRLPPGETLREWMVETDTGGSELASAMGIHPDHLSLLLRGVAEITGDIAERLERRTGVGARFWLNLQSNYTQSQATMSLVSLDRALEEAGEQVRYYTWMADDDQIAEARSRLVGLIATMMRSIASDIAEGVAADSGIMPDRIVRGLRQRATELSPSSAGSCVPQVNRSGEKSL
jgi:HTH-type transcriptional regulator/antitoxin HigA